MPWDRARTKIACRVAGVDRQKLTDAINAGDYPAPETTAGVARVFLIDDLAGLFIYGRLTHIGESSRRACDIVSLILSALKSSPSATRIVIVEAANGLRSAINWDDWNQDAETYVTGTTLLRSTVWYIEAYRNLIKANLADEERIGGEED